MLTWLIVKPTDSLAWESEHVKWNVNCLRNLTPPPANMENIFSLDYFLMHISLCGKLSMWTWKCIFRMFWIGWYPLFLLISLLLYCGRLSWNSGASSASGSRFWPLGRMEGEWLEGERLFPGLLPTMMSLSWLLSRYPLTQLLSAAENSSFPSLLKLVEWWAQGHSFCDLW